MPKRRALLIAVDKYDDESFKDLKSPVTDADKLEAALSDPRCEDFEIERVRPDASLVEVQQSIERFFEKSDPKDLTLFYFSGHGKKDRRQRLNFVLKDTKADTLRSTSLTAKFLKEHVEDCASAQLITILDCCHAGAFTESGAKGDDALPLSNFDPAGQGRYTLGAASGHQLAWEKDGTSLFSKYLIEALTFAGDANSKAKMTVNGAHDYIIHKLRGTKVAMTPPLNVENRRLAVVLARNENYVPPTYLLSEEAPVPSSVETNATKSTWSTRAMLGVIGLLTAAVVSLGYTRGHDPMPIAGPSIEFYNYRTKTKYRRPSPLNDDIMNGRAMPWVAREFGTCIEPTVCVNERRIVDVRVHPSKWSDDSGEPFPSIQLPLLCTGMKEMYPELALSRPLMHSEIGSWANATAICRDDVGDGFFWYAPKQQEIEHGHINHTSGLGKRAEYLSDPGKRFRSSMSIEHGFWTFHEDEPTSKSSP